MVVEKKYKRTGKHAGDYVALVSDEDAGLLTDLTWSLMTPKNALYLYNQKTKQLLHRLILEKTLHRTLEKGEQVDHINRNGLDNRRENLRLANQTEQNANQRTRKDNTSGHRGVSWSEDRQKWESQINHKGKKFFIGRFDKFEDACAAYKAKAITLFGEFLNLE